MAWVPTPAVAGVKVVPLTPDPLYVPPAGVAPVNVTGFAPAQTAVSGGKVITGEFATVIGWLTLPVHPLDVTE
ncbi:MAG: hypothetical protein F6K11_33985 [Leptolyngbya sp. SIO3F4]|nr:hypothetical protein [Leptolyngbya sp. SIO3F4]